MSTFLRKIAKDRLFSKTAGAIGSSASGVVGGVLGSASSAVGGVGSSASGIGSSASAGVGDIASMPFNAGSASSASSASSGDNKYKASLEKYIREGGTHSGWLMRKLFPLSSRLYVGSSGSSLEGYRDWDRGGDFSSVLESMSEGFKDGAAAQKLPSAAEYQKTWRLK